MIALLVTQSVTKGKFLKLSEVVPFLSIFHIPYLCSTPKLTCKINKKILKMWPSNVTGFESVIHISKISFFKDDR